MQVFAVGTGSFYFRPLFVLAASALWLVAGLDWAANTLNVVQSMDLDGLLLFIAGLNSLSKL